MKKQTLLVLAASLVLPLTQCTDKTATTNNTDTSAAVVQQRAVAYSTLAAIPADVEAVVSLNHVAQIVQGLAANGLIPADQVTEDVTMWDGGALALSTKAMGTLEKLLPAIKKIQMSQAVSGGEGPALSEEDAKALAAAIDSCGPIGPIYATIAVNPGAEAKLAEMYNKCMADLVQKKDVYAEYNGYKGIHKNLVDSEHLAELPAPLQEALKKHSIYAVSKLVGNTVQIVVCEDVADIRHAATPEESVLATDKLKAGDSRLGNSSYLISYGSEKLADLTNQMSTISEELDTLSAMLTDALGDSPEAATIKDAAAKIVAEFKKLDNVAPTKFADFMQIWSDGTIHMEARGDARGATFEAAKLIGAPHAANAAAYVEWTPGSCDCDFSMTNVWNAVEQTLPAIAKMNPEAQEMYTQYQKAKPVIESVGKALGTVGSGMGGSSFVMVDGNGSMPSDKPEGTAVPRLVYASGVTNRAAFAQGWAQLKEAAAQGLTAYGEDPGLVNMLAPQEVQKGKATVTSLATPVNGPDFAPNVAISDQVIAFGSSPEQTAIVANTDTASAESFAGIKFSVNMDALSKLTTVVSELMDGPDAQQCVQKAAQYVKSVSGTVTVEGGECIIRIDTQFK